MIKHNPLNGKPFLSPTAFRTVVELWNLSGKTSIIPVSGRSMLPFIRPKDRLLVSHRIRKLHIGDVITFYDSGLLVVHRIMRLKNQLGSILVTTKGDNSRTYDNPVSFDDILGRVVAIQRNDFTLSLDRPSMRIKGWLIATRSIFMKKVPAFFNLGHHSLFRRIKRQLNTLFTGATLP